MEYPQRHQNTKQNLTFVNTHPCLLKRINPGNDYFDLLAILSGISRGKQL
jgi:hypothetical protein